MASSTIVAVAAVTLLLALGTPAHASNWHCDQTPTRVKGVVITACINNSPNYALGGAWVNVDRQVIFKNTTASKLTVVTRAYRGMQLRKYAGFGPWGDVRWEDPVVGTHYLSPGESETVTLRRSLLEAPNRPGERWVTGGSATVGRTTSAMSTYASGDPDT
ncbi:hypothetical protein AB0O76_17450 [Streptomyces sp. NPDC086554]|uniref:hypothetical protein n=1 Tax=Streptomyces sp. NPDC086554 TaxID=3154864 RepID=UPI00343E80C3